MQTLGVGVLQPSLEVEGKPHARKTSMEAWEPQSEDRGRKESPSRQGLTKYKQPRQTTNTVHASFSY